MKISILLPLKETYSTVLAGAVSILVNSHLKHSQYKKCYKTKSLAMKNEYLLKKDQKRRNLIKKKFIENH